MDLLPLLGIIVPSVLGGILLVICTFFLVTICYKKWRRRQLEDDTEALTGRDEVDYTFGGVDNPQCQQQQRDPDRFSVSSCELSIVDERTSGPGPPVASTSHSRNTQHEEKGNVILPQNDSSNGHEFGVNVSQVTVVEINTRTCGNDHDLLESSTPPLSSCSPTSSSSWATAGTTTPPTELPLHFDSIYDLALAGCRRRSKSLPASEFIAIANGVCSTSSSPISKLHSSRPPVSRRLDFQDDTVSVYEERDCEVVKVKRARHSFSVPLPEQNLEEDDFVADKRIYDNGSADILNVLRNCYSDFPKSNNLLDDRYVSASFMKAGIKYLQDIQEEKDVKIIYLAQKLILHKEPRDYGLNETKAQPSLIIGVDATKDHMAGYLVNLKTKSIKFYVINSSDSPWIIFQRFSPMEFEMKNFLLALCVWNKDIVDHGRFMAYTDNTGVNSSLHNYGCWVQELLKHFTDCKNAELINKDSYVNRRTDLESFAKYIQPADDLSRFEIGSCLNFLCEYYFIGKENVIGTHQEMVQGTAKAGQKRYEKSPYYDAVLKMAEEFINTFECAPCKNNRVNLSLRDNLNIRPNRRCSSLSPPKAKRKKRKKSTNLQRSNSST